MGSLKVSSALGLLALLASGWLPVSAQTTALDEGSFRLLQGGRQIGTETFTIRQSGSGESAVIIAQGRVVVDTTGGGEVTTSLEVAGPVLRPAAYQATVQGDQAQRIAGRVVGGRFSARIVSSSGEQMREYLASDGAVVVDEGVAHHHYFLARRLGSGAFTVPIIIPRQSRQVSARVTVQGSETVDVGGSAISAQRLVVEPAGGPARHVWVDAQGRVLRLEIPTRNFTAQRVAPPAS